MRLTGIQRQAPIEYGLEIDALRRAATTVAANPRDVDAVARLVKLAVGVQAYLDTHPLDPEIEIKAAEIRQLVRLMQNELTGEDAASVPTVVKNITSDTPEGERAAGKLKEMLPKLGKTSYDLAVKLIGDIASAAAKKMLGM